MANFLTSESEEERLAYIETMSKYYPLGRLAETSDIAKAILFLASDDSSFITGIDLVIDGGLTAGPIVN